MEVARPTIERLLRTAFEQLDALTPDVEIRRHLYAGLISRAVGNAEERLPGSNVIREAIAEMFRAIHPQPAEGALQCKAWCVPQRRRVADVLMSEHRPSTLGYPQAARREPTFAELLARIDAADEEWRAGKVEQMTEKTAGQLLDAMSGPHLSGTHRSCLGTLHTNKK